MGGFCSSPVYTLGMKRGGEVIKEARKGERPEARHTESFQWKEKTRFLPFWRVYEFSHNWPECSTERRRLTWFSLALLVGTANKSGAFLPVMFYIIIIIIFRSKCFN